MNKNSFWLGMFLGGIAGTVIALKGRRLKMDTGEQEISYGPNDNYTDTGRRKYSTGGTGDTDYNSSTGGEGTYTAGENNYNRQNEGGGNYTENISSMFNFEEKLNRLEQALEDLNQTINQE
ncbi:MAG: hypothetical protein ACOCZM_00830 [Bacillota bacterium]